MTRHSIVDDHPVEIERRLLDQRIDFPASTLRIWASQIGGEIRAPPGQYGNAPRGVIRNIAMFGRVVTGVEELLEQLVIRQRVASSRCIVDASLIQPLEQPIAILHPVHSLKPGVTAPLATSGIARAPNLSSGISRKAAAM